ncbi:MAG: IS66 family transposase, partial [Terriglobia bacterium]
MGLNFCSGCFEKQRRIDRLEEEVRSLKQKLRYREREAGEGPFGSSTPSARRPFKVNTSEEQRAKVGGARRGHLGHGRATVDAGKADRCETVMVQDACPYCAGPLEKRGFRSRSVLDAQPLRAKRIAYQLQRKYCPRCRKFIQAQAPGVLPKSLAGNQFITQIVFLHYRHGLPMGRVCQQLGIGLGTAFAVLHRIASRFAGLIPKLLQEYRQAAVRHADETGWRNDGRSGYAWLFATSCLSVFLFRPSRSARVASEALGQEQLPGVLVVDRYKGYHRAPCAIQYCYAHLLRGAEDLGKEFPEHAEVQNFTSTLIPQLSAAMHLHSQPLSDAEYAVQAHAIQQEMQKVIDQPAQHLGVRAMQNLFRENAARLYHWVEDRRVPADNNRAERELRPTVIARKTSFGSQSDAGAKTREILMTLVRTLTLRFPDPQAHFKSVLDQLAEHPARDPIRLLFP